MKSNNPGKDCSESQERRIAKLLGGKTQANSGGTRFGGGDVHTSKFLIEAKTPVSEKSSFSIKKEWLDKAKEQAYEQHKQYSALAFCFDPEGPDYFVIDKKLFQELLEYLDKEVPNE